ncbi:hypothetical protein K7432_012633 [Basidiobolus ranarum]|uniref:Metallo-beta-lactamase domain-containing protein n=1 Tax=Basidiobolus ranarum TaxID=34480 RepID=A0ABR2VRZ2_9FUNG
MNNLVVPTNLKLHIIYAQRGDAFVLDYIVNNNRRLLLVDGGPTSAFHGAYSEGGPYFRHYLAAIRDIWGKRNTDNIALDIVVSHADDDHYGGILALLTKQKLTIRDPTNWNNVNELTPYYEFPGYTKIVNAAKKLHLRAERLIQNQLAGFTMLVPGPNDIIRLHAGSIGINGDQMDIKTYIGATLTNSSILIFQNNNDNNSVTLDGSVLFTGDSSGCNILPPIGQNVPHLAVYKISHHGAFMDSVPIMRSD